MLYSSTLFFRMNPLPDIEHRTALELGQHTALELFYGVEWPESDSDDSDYIYTGRLQSECPSDSEVPEISEETPHLNLAGQDGASADQARCVYQMPNKCPS
jgi:hypothetical protein